MRGAGSGERGSRTAALRRQMPLAGALVLGLALLVIGRWAPGQMPPPGWSGGGGGGGGGAHAANHAENGADELLVENLGTACDSGETGVSDGSGGLDCTVVGGGTITITDDQTFANEPATCSPGDEFLPTDNPFLDGYCPSANTWAYRALGQRVTLPTGTWSFVNTASSTQSQTAGTLRFTTPKSGTVSITGLCRTPDTSIVGTFDFVFLNDMTGRTPGVSGTRLNHGVAVGFYESATGKFVTMRIAVDGSGLLFVVDKWTNSTTFSGGYVTYQTAGQGIDQVQQNPIVLRIQNDDTNLKFFWSMNRGKDFEEFDSRAKADFFTTAPDQACLIHYANGDRVVTELLSYTGN